MKSFPAQRPIACGVSLVFLVTHGLLASTPETNLWVERRKASRQAAEPLSAALPLVPPSNPFSATPYPAPPNAALALSRTAARSVPKGFLKEHAGLLSALSLAHGTIRKVTFAPRGSSIRPVVIHIQDVHMNAEAQWNIREAVRSLLQTGRVNLVALEGASEEIPLQPFVDFPNRRAVEAAAGHLLKENKISGPIHAAMTAQGTLPQILGIDEPVHYRANVQAYRDSAPKRTIAREWINEQKSGIEAEKRRVFSPALRAFDAKVESHREGKMSLGDYVLLLSSFPPPSPAPPSPRTASPPVSLFIEALTLERTMDFRRVEAERARLIEALSAKLTKQETDALLAQSLAYRSGRRRYADFHGQLKDLCRRKGIDLTAYPAVEAYVKYVLLADEIDGEMLLEDLAAREKAAYGTLAKSDPERNLIAASRRTWLTAKLVDFALTPVEWRELNGSRPALSPFPTPSLDSFRSFYQEADARDAAMAANLVAAVSLTPRPRQLLATVLVTGGYHAEGMAQALSARGFTVVSYVPKIEKVDSPQGAAYLSVFTQEKAPLDRLFEGQQLHLANDPVPASVIQMAAPGLIAVADNAETFDSVEKTFFSLIPSALSARIAEVVEKTSKGLTRLKIIFKDGWVYTVDAASDASSPEPRFTTSIKKQSLNPLRRIPELFNVRNLFNAFPPRVDKGGEQTPAAVFAPPFSRTEKRDSNRGTSLWMAEFFEQLGFLWGGEITAGRWGAHYMAHAPTYEWSLGFAAASANFGAALFLAGTAWAMIPLFVTALFLPSHVFPARWRKTDVEVGWGKAGFMAVLYFALVASAPFLVMDFSWAQTFLQATGWGLTLFLHRGFDPIVDNSALWEGAEKLAGTFFLLRAHAGNILPPTAGEMGSRSISGINEPVPVGDPVGSVLVSDDYVPGIYRENDLVEEFPQEISANQKWSREGIIDRQLTLLVLNGELGPEEKEELKTKASARLAEAEGAPGFNPTIMERDVLTCSIVKEVAEGKDDFNPFSVRNMKTNSVAAALQENGLTLRRRFMRLLYCFWALKHIPDKDLYHLDGRVLADKLLEKVRSFDNRPLLIDAFESYIQRVVKAQKPITVPVFLDDNGEAVFALRFILDQMRINKNLHFVLVPRNGQFREDASVDDIKKILNLPVFKTDLRLVGDRLRVVPGCAGDGADVRRFSQELVNILRSADVVLSIGQMNFEGLNTFKKDVYFLFVSTALGNNAVSGVPVGKGIFAFLPAGTTAFSNYTDKSFRRFRYRAGETIPVAGRTLIEAARLFPENKINEHFDVLDNSPRVRNDVATGWMGFFISSWGDAFPRAFREKIGSAMNKFDTLEKRLFHRRAEKSEDVVNAMVSVLVGWVAGQTLDVLSWLSLGTLSPPVAVVFSIVPLIGVWGALFVVSHAVAPKALQRLTGRKPSVIKAARLFLIYLVPLSLTALGGAFLASQGLSPLLSALIPVGTFSFVRSAHDRINRAPGAPSTAVPDSASLTTDQRRFAAIVTAILGAKPTRLGLDDYMYGAAQAAVRAAAGGPSVGNPAPSREDLPGTPVLFVDARSVATERGRNALAVFIRKKPYTVIFTNAEDLQMAGADVRVRRDIFTLLKTSPEDLPSGVVEVALAPLGPELSILARRQGLQIFQTSALKLNPLGLDAGVADAVKKAWLLSDLFTLLAPSLVPEKWEDVLKALHAIARSA